MNKIIILQGIPGSGKSTWAKNFVKDNPSYIIVNRDSLRNGAGEYWVPSREEYITKLEELAITNALDLKYNVIIDATNFNKKTLEKWFVLASKYDVIIELKKFEISLREAIERDSKRERSVGEKVIKRFYNKYCNQSDNRKILPYKENKEDVIICDIDGTISLRTDRNPFETDKYLTDKPEWRICKLLQQLSKVYKIIFLSGREGTPEAKKDTLQWLHANTGLNDFTLYMRSENDKRPDDYIKLELYKKYIEPTYNVLAVFDDRNRIVDMWRNQGILCCQVYYGDF